MFLLDTLTLALNNIELFMRLEPVISMLFLVVIAVVIVSTSLIGLVLILVGKSIKSNNPAPQRMVPQLNFKNDTEFLTELLSFKVKFYYENTLSKRAISKDSFVKEAEIATAVKNILGDVAPLIGDNYMVSLSKYFDSKQMVLHFLSEITYNEINKLVEEINRKKIRK